MKLDAEEIRLELRAHDVVNAYGLRIARRTQKWWRMKECPRCRDTSSRLAIAINHENGSWLHHGKERAAGGECSGDIFDLVAALEGWDCRRDFGRIIRRAAEIAGIEPDDSHDAVARRERAHREAVERAAQADADDRKRHDRARRLAAFHWDSLATSNPRGEAYLRSRGLDPSLLTSCVRFTKAGDIVVALRDLDGSRVDDTVLERIPDGAPVSTATRMLEPGDGPKVLTLRECPTRGTMIDCVADIVHGRDVYLVEGVADALTARIAFPDAVVLGANGAGALPKIAAIAVPRVHLARTRLFLIPHDDEQGIASATKAARIALAAGLALDQELFLVELSHKDLNAAWQADWRPLPRPNGAV